MSFADELQNDLAEFFNPEEFGEEVIYAPKGGAPRPITVVINRGSRRRQDEQYHRTDVDSIEVSARFDSVLGINEPQIGETIRLAEDPHGREYSLTVERHRDAAAIVLEFTRKKLNRAGRYKPEQQ